ncbi:conserved hypothetical protein [Paecilomyces variotii No. 5]|uniref:Uncharacterized protein n=1 Tax=Byssochlamys spectabilis (strain No. 5 / NBRC 109023) TaxID=1356009 RepID=V5FQL2_BYSSN|nr:conserved hypothetical protein [Paecilomyces variotii No. 5]
MMDVRKLDQHNWLTMDKNYMEEHQVRVRLLELERPKVFQCLPESREACTEALREVVTFLCERYPWMFEQTQTEKEMTVHNKKTGETFVFGGSNNSMEPLEVAVRLSMEDLSILLKNADDEYYLAASGSLFPVGWAVAERIGWTVAQLHSPVPLWREQVSASVSKFLARLTPESPMERSNYFVELKGPNEGLYSTLFRPDGLSEASQNPRARDIIIRRERQTFRKLPQSGALLFGVKTTLTPLDELPTEELHNLVREMGSWPEEVANYKGKDVWGPSVLDFCKQTIGLPQAGETSAV